jgi:hypothetical protein
VDKCDPWHVGKLGRNTTRTGYQLRRALDLQAEALCSRLGLSKQAVDGSCRARCVPVHLHTNRPGHCANRPDPKNAPQRGARQQPGGPFLGCAGGPLP